MVTRQQIVEEARTWRNVPWKHQGRTRTGVDCVGLAVTVALRLGLADSSADVRSYPRRPDGSFVAYFRKHMVEILPREAQDGDVLLFNQEHYSCHCGIRTTKHAAPAVIHAHAARRKVIEEPLEQARSVVGHPVFAFRFKTLET